MTILSFQSSQPLSDSRITESKEILYSSQSDDRNIVCITSTKEFFALKEDWNKLLEQSINPHPFVLWEWMFTWWETYQQEHKDKLCVLALYEANTLVAIAPFYIKTKGLFIKRLSLLGEGEHKNDAAVTTYPDIIVKKEYRSHAVSSFSTFLNKAKNTSLRFNYASFNMIHKESILQKLGDKLTNDYIKRKKHSENQFVISLPEGENDYLASLSKSTKKQFRLKFNRIKKEGDIEITSETNLSDGLEILEKLHRARWAPVNNKNAFDSGKFMQFHKTLCEAYQEQDIMDIRVMRHAGKPIAAAYNFNYQNNCYSYLSGFQSSDDRRFSPMFIFDMLEIKRLINKDYDSYDMLVSESQNNYKTKFGSDVNSVYKIHWLKKGAISSSMLMYMKARPALAKIYRIISK